MSKTSTFADLTDRYRRASRPADELPLPLAVVAARLGISRQHLFNLTTGRFGASDELEEKIAAVYGLSLTTVHRALVASKLIGGRR